MAKKKVTKRKISSPAITTGLVGEDFEGLLSDREATPVSPTIQHLVDLPKVRTATPLVPDAPPPPVERTARKNKPRRAIEAYQSVRTPGSVKRRLKSLDTPVSQKLRHLGTEPHYQQ